MVHRTFRTQFLHFDSISASYIKDVNSTSSSTLNPYNAIYPMNQTFKNIKRVYLSSVEIPVFFTNIRKGATDTLKFNYNGTNYSVTLAENTYTTIATLRDDINAALVGIVPGVTISINTYSTTRMWFTFSGTPAITSFNIIDTNLSKYILGFRAGIDSYSALAGGCKATIADWCLTYDSYLLMYIPNLNGMNASQSGQQSTFKVPLNTVNSNQVYYYFDKVTFKQWVDITDPRLTISNLQVNLVDRFGYNLNPLGHDFSFTLALELYD